MDQASGRAAGHHECDLWHFGGAGAEFFRNNVSPLIAMADGQFPLL
jgi:hypothetical protein